MGPGPQRFLSSAAIERQDLQIGDPATAFPPSIRLSRSLIGKSTVLLEIDVGRQRG
jgi:hypothetical protein